nr:transient receptor potential cation channel protein painless-like [Megalopta genalis]XP_033343080.1 transient receptor potential cation channel protein painless-like [Megalopta genalis]XP_033343081.1 transient receptor potential cation channel protein painless-like [Megalopta genalis]XP_033343082.1 transient receptor potential cation channel protein painless-like [Megalopta genalis]
MDREDEVLQMHLLRDYRSSFTRTRLHEQLLDSLRSRNIKLFASLLEQISKSGVDINRVYPGEPGETCLDIACMEGLTDFVPILLEKGADVNRINEDANYAAIHYAMEQGHEDVLRVLLENPMVNPNLQAASQTALHIAVSNDNLVCAALLLEKGASPNVVNSKGLTPLHMAAMRKQRAMVELILDKATLAPDLDSYKDYNKETTRDVLKRLLPDLLLPPPVDRRPDVNLLKYHLTANDEKSFLECLKNISNNAEIDAENLIAMAAQRNFENAISELFKRRPVSYNLEKAADIAIQKNSPHILRLLLNNFADMDVEAANRLLFTVCIDLGIPGSGGSQDTLNRLECLRLVLERDQVNVRCTDGKGNTPLHYAARADSREAMAMLLAKGSYIGHVNAFGSPAVADIPASTLSQYFDDCIQARREHTNEYLIEFDYRCLNPHNTDPKQHRREMDLFQYIAGNTGLKHLLKHPLLSSFIYLKWQKIRLVLRASFAFHLLLYVLLNAYIIGAAGTRTFTKSDNQISEALPEIPPAVIIFRTLASIVLSILAFWKLFQLVTSPCCYVSNFGNWCELVLVFLEFLVLYDVGPDSLAAPVTLLSAWHLVVMMGQYSWLSADIEIFKTVSWKFLRFLAVYALLIFAFALAFFVLFQQNENFLDLGQSMFKTIIMLTGEFDADEIPFKSYPYMSHLVFVLFVFLIAIVLLNLLNGLAVNDTTEILGKAELIGLISRIRLISYVENIVTNSVYDHAPHCRLSHYCLCNWRCKPLAFLTSQVLVFPEYLRKGTLSVELYNRSKMDSGIIKRAREILSRKDRESDTERIIGELDKVKERLALIDVSLNALRQGLDNNNRTDDSTPS